MAGDVTISSQKEDENKNFFIGEDKDRYAPSTEYNVLHDYRSYNYVITLSAMTRDQYNDENFFKNEKPLNYLILKSSGKGARQLTATDLSAESITEANAANTSTTLTSAAQGELNDLVSNFNSTGYGRYDFFIDNLEIETVWNTTNGSQPTKIRFDVYEPLSISGFIESLRINALAAGFENQFDCVFALKIEFIGYPDDENKLPAPKVIPHATRYFPVNINQVGLETTEAGTKYRVACTCKNQMGQGEDGKLATTAKMKGSTIKQVLESLMEQVTEARKNDSGTEETKNYNEYLIEFVDGPDKSAADIANKEINEYLRSNQVYVFPTPGDKDAKSSIKTASDPTKAKYNSTEETITFNTDSSIMDVITAVIRDSKYTEELLGTLEEAKKKNNGMIPWFRVTVDSKIKPGKNDKTGVVNYIYTYKVRPYMTHVSKLPGQGQGMFDGDELKGQIRRSYNYMYTGKNVDILNFQLKFNHLFFQQRAYKFGNKDSSGTASAAGASKTEKLEAQPTELTGKVEGQTPIPNYVATSAGSQMPLGGLGKDFQANPYQKFGQLVHEALLDSQDYNDIRLTIIGDPYYLVTANLGNQEEEEDPNNKGITKNGQAPYLGGDVLINLNFRTPKEIKPNGWAEFGDGLLPFSGIFKVTNIVNTFREGKFEQQIRAYRLPGQVVNNNARISAGGVKSTPKEGEQQQKDTSSLPQSGQRASLANVMNMLSRGFPNPVTNFTNAIGGALGGVNTAVQTTLQRVDQSLADALAPVNGVLQQAQAALNVAAQIGGVVAAGAALINGFDNPGGAPGLGYNPNTSGTRLNTDGLDNFFTGDTLKNQANVVSQSRIVSSFIQNNNNLRVLNQNYYNNVVSERVALADNKVSNVGNKAVAVTNNSPVDPKALAYQLGIDPAQLSGLSGGQQSDILSRLAALAAKLPENTSIAELKALGISMSNIYGASIPNLPAIQPLTLAPLANVPQFDIQKILASGGNVGNLSGALAVPGIAAFLALLNANKNVPENGLVGGQGQLNVQSTLDKLETAQNMSINLQSNGNFSNAQVGLGSVESVVSNNSKIVQGYGGYYVISKTSYAQYGTQRTSSPIDKLMQQQTTSPTLPPALGALPDQVTLTSDTVKKALQ